MRKGMAAHLDLRKDFITAITGCLSSALPLFVVDVIGFPFVFGLVLAGGMPHRDDAVGGDVLGQPQCLDRWIHAFLVGIAGRPDGTQAQGFGRQEEVLRGCRAVGRPVMVLSAHFPRSLSADDDDDRRLGNHLVEAHRQFILGGLLPDHHKTPGLHIHPGRSRHGRLQQGFHLFGGNILVRIGTDTFTGEYVLQGSLAVILGKTGDASHSDKGGKGEF